MHNYVTLLINNILCASLIISSKCLWLSFGFNKIEIDVKRVVLVLDIKTTLTDEGISSAASSILGAQSLVGLHNISPILKLQAAPLTKTTKTTTGIFM